MDKKLFFSSLLLVLGLGLSITSFWEAWDTHSSSPGSHVEPAVVVGGGGQDVTIIMALPLAQAWRNWHSTYQGLVANVPPSALRHHDWDSWVVS